MGLLKKKKKNKTLKDDGSDSEGDNLDLKVEMHPLSNYISDQDELVNQMFLTIRGSKLDSMLPGSLKNIPLPELKKLCLHELRGMSKKRILCVINGQEMVGSSESEEEEEDDDVSVEENQTKSTPETKTAPNAEKNGESSSNDQAFPEYLMKTIKIEPPDETSHGDKNVPGKKSVLELLELQMRARIIKTMLEKSEDGKTLTEGAIAALIGTTATESQISEIAAAHPEISKVLSEGDSNQGGGAKESKVKEENSKEKRGKTKRNSEGERHRDDDARHSRSSHKKSHRSKSSDARRGSKRRNNSDIKDDADAEKKSKRDRSSDERSKTKKKITRREFAERMKRAKKNRTYRQRKSSEDEEQANASKDQEASKDEGVTPEEKSKKGSEEKSKKGSEEKSKKGSEEKSKKGSEEKSKKGSEENGNKKSDIEGTLSGKEEGEVASGKEGEAQSEKEEGECDTDDDEEGACSPSDISSASYYSSSCSYSSHSRSRSYSRSWSKSPLRRRGRGYSRGKSRSRSRSRSRSNDKKRTGGGRWSSRRTKDRGASGPKNKSGGIVSLPGGNQKQQKEEEENWGQKCDIEFVDSEEDFDDNTTDAGKVLTVDGTKKPLPTKGQNSERASISFSLQKKVVPSITPNVDLDDLPLKFKSSHMLKERNSDFLIATRSKKEDIPKLDEIIDLDSPKVAASEILISSDSENEAQPSSKSVSVRVEKRGFVRSATEVPGSSLKNKSSSGEMLKTVTSVDNADGNVPAPSRGMGAKHSDHNLSSNLGDYDKQEANVESKVLVREAQQNLLDEMQVESPDISEKTVAQKQNTNASGNEVLDVETVSTRDLYVQGNEVIGEKIGKDGEDDIKKPDIDFQNAPEVEKGVNELKCVKINRYAETACVVNETIRNKESESLEASTSINTEKVMNNSVESIYNVETGTETLSEKPEENVENIPAVTVCKVNEAKVLKQRKSSRKQNVKLEHLHELFDEEQSLIQDSCTAEQKAPPSRKCNLQDITSCPTQVMTQDEPCTNVSLEIEDECKDIHTIGEGGNSNILRRDIEEGIVTKNTEEEPITKPDGEQHEYIQDGDDKVNKGELSEDFYRGAEQLTFSDDEAQNCSKTNDDIIQDDREVEPIRIDTGLIRRRVTRSRKVEMAAPDKSWTKKERKKKEKAKDVLAMEGVGLLKTQLAESSQSPLSKEDDDQFRLQDSSEGKEISDQGNDEDTCASWGVSSISSKEDISQDFKIQSPRDNLLEDRETSLKGEGDGENQFKEEVVLQKRTGQETEIIGVIETSHDPDADHMDGIDLGGSSWSMRWLQSEKVQKVVSSSKMLSRVRKKIQKKEKAIKVTPPPKPEITSRKLPEPVVPIIGSIEEYERLFGMKAKSSAEGVPSSSAASPSSSAAAVLESGQSIANQESAKPQKKTSFGSDDEGEDSEEEALWSKILRK